MTLTSVWSKDKKKNHYLTMHVNSSVRFRGDGNDEVTDSEAPNPMHAETHQQ